MRAVKMEGVDLAQFQFDYDQTWCAFFLNADGTIYGRFGTRAGSGAHSTSHISVASFKKAMQRALAAHEDYPKNKESFAHKRGPAPEYADAEKIPGVQKHHCIHCHQVRDSTLRNKWQERKLTAADLWCYPLPENVGLLMDVDDGLRVKKVSPHSPAAGAGIQPGDDLLTLSGQRLLSQADIQWVLHNVPNDAPNDTKVSATLIRNGQTLTKSLALQGQWKKTDLAWRESFGPGLRYGLWTVVLSPEERRKQKIPDDALALAVKNLFLPRAEPLTKAGLRVGDVIVGVDDNFALKTETDAFVYIRLTHPPGDKLTLTIRRGGEEMKLEVPAW